eukprot:COSAG01_NODE_38969_length_482_cov_72.825065_1_plen_66_part_01
MPSHGETAEPAAPHGMPRGEDNGLCRWGKAFGKWTIALCAQLAARVSPSGWSGFGCSSGFGLSGSC